MVPSLTPMFLMETSYPRAFGNWKQAIHELFIVQCFLICLPGLSHASELSNSNSGSIEASLFPIHNFLS
jgi:hypothetical protein